MVWIAVSLPKLRMDIGKLNRFYYISLLVTLLATSEEIQGNGGTGNAP